MPSRIVWEKKEEKRGCGQRCVKHMKDMILQLDVGKKVNMNEKIQLSFSRALLLFILHKYWSEMFEELKSGL